MNLKLQKLQLFRFLNANKNILIILIVSTLIFLISIQYNFGRYENMGTFKYDTGNMTQLLYNTLHGRLLMFTDYNGENVFRFSEHVDPTILLVLPFYFIWQSPKTLMLVQALVIMLAIIPLFKISLIKLKNKWLATIFVLIFLFSPLVGNLLVTDFHAVAFCVLFILLAYYSILKNHNFYYLLFFILAILSKENVALSFIPLSFVIYKVYKNKKIGIITFVISVLYSYLAFTVLIPAFRGQEQSVHASFDLAYSYLGSSYPEVIKNLLFHPIETFNILMQPSRLNYLKNILGLYGFLPLLLFPYNLIILPEILLNGLSNIGAMRNFTYQYTSIIIPLLFISLINALTKISKYLKVQFVILTVILFFNLNYSINQSNIPIQLIASTIFKSNNSSLSNSNSTVINPFQPRFTQTPYNIVKLISKNETVSAPNFMGAHLSEREYIAMYPAKYNEFENVIAEHYNSTLPPIVYSLYKKNIFEDNRKYLNYLLTSNEYKLILAENGLAYFKKIDIKEKFQLPKISVISNKKYKLNNNVQITKPEIQVINNQQYLVTSFDYITQSDKPLIYTFKTLLRKFQVMDLNQYANSDLELNYLSVIPIKLSEKDLKNTINITVSEHSFDDNLSIRSSTNFIKFDNIKRY